ncbi:hypothetical protein B0A50_04113 [Salinomyces thailandicus]|uniref:Endosomal/vacuolar adapter protein YPT35 n=1 Tax=Salinomyces thailandicus TaxID=706561 RepID=A0A4U0U104_9PEZI|nr:hypothetical protein B0A50_04113 [Salinomyces thailandica]
MEPTPPTSHPKPPPPPPPPPPEHNDLPPPATTPETATGDSASMQGGAATTTAPTRVSHPAPDTTQQSHPITNTPPPFWTRQGRSISTASYHSINQHPPNPILLEDHTEETHEASQGCWAKSVAIDDYTILTGPSGIGAYVVWHCTVSTLQGGDLELRKRYSEFDQLRVDLVRSFPHAEAMIPQLPRKSVVSKFRARFLEHRKQGLNHFLSCILLNPEFAASPVLKGFIFS